MAPCVANPQDVSHGRVTSVLGAVSLLQEFHKDTSLQVASQRTLEYGQVVLAADNVFNRCRQKSYNAHASESNPLQQLEIIGNYISDLLTICKKHGLCLRSS